MSSASCDCHYNGSSNFFNKATNLCRFSCSRVFLPSSDKDTSSLAYISRCLSTSHSPSYRFLVCQVLSAGFSTQERRLCLRENLPFISGDNKMKRGFGTLYLSPLFVFVLYASLLSAPLWSLFIQLEARLRTETNCSHQPLLLEPHRCVRRQLHWEPRLLLHLKQTNNNNTNKQHQQSLTTTTKQKQTPTQTKTQKPMQTPPTPSSPLCIPVYLSFITVNS